MAAPMVHNVHVCRYRLSKVITRQIVKQICSKSQASAAAAEQAEGGGERRRERVELVGWVAQGLAANTLSPKKHPGRMVTATPTLPQRLLDATQILLEKYPVSDLSRRADRLANYLWRRQPPASDADVTQLANQVFQEFTQKRESQGNSEPVEREEVLKAVRNRMYCWQPVRYDAYNSLLYLTSRLSHNYSVLLQCFREISLRDPKFAPRSIFNLGSGLGTAVWAADSIWGSAVSEHYCVDTSQDMNTVARLLLQDGDSQRQMSIPGVTLRQFPPSPLTVREAFKNLSENMKIVSLSGINQFDMVVSAYTMLDHPGPGPARLQMVEDLWRMAVDTLILVENGTMAGFTLLNEARQHLMELSNSSQDDLLKGYIFAPCPHSNACPKFTNKNQSCFSQVPYKSLPYNATRPAKNVARYSYLIMRKGRRKVEAWPRVVQHTVKASGHTHCHLCCHDNSIRHLILTARKHGKDVYKCSRYTVWGDLFPVSLVPDE